MIRRAPAVIQPPNADEGRPVPGNGPDADGGKERFMGERLGAALAGAQVPPPAQVLDGELTNAFQRA